MSLLSRRLDQKALTMPGGGREQFQLINGRLITIDDNPQNYIDKAYSINDIIYSIVKLIMDKVSVAPWAIYKVQDESSYKNLMALRRKGDWTTQDFLLSKDLHRKALVLDTNAGKYAELLRDANEYETFGEQFTNGCGYKLLTGNRYVWGNILEAGANRGIPNELWLLPSQYMSIIASMTFPAKALGYRLDLANLDFTPEQILHEKYWNPNWDVNGRQLYGVAPLRASLRTINRDNSSLESSTQRFQNQGVSGILHMKGAPGMVDGSETVKEVQALKKTLVTEWTGERNHGKIGVSGYDMGWLPIGLTAEEMQQIENEKWNLRRLCNPFGIPSQLLNDPENKTFNSLEEAEKALTTRCAFPLLNSGRDAYNRVFHRSWGLDKNKVIDYDQSVYTELQDDMKDLTDWAVKLSQATGVSPNTVLSWVGMEKINDPRYDVPRVTQQMGQTIEEYDLNEVDNALNNAEDNSEEDI